MKYSASIIGLISLLALSACVQSHWERPNATADLATAELASADLAECRRSAQQEAFRQVNSYGDAGAPLWRYAPYYEPLRSRTHYEQWAAGERLLLQTRLADYCMRVKGYERVIEQKP
ncbi:MAG: hypothetical protein ABI439_06285 [Rhodospirillales bacterium]